MFSDAVGSRMLALSVALAMFAFLQPASAGSDPPSPCQVAWNQSSASDTCNKPLLFEQLDGDKCRIRGQCRARNGSLKNYGIVVSRSWVPDLENCNGHPIRSQYC